jgi:hypothetical protein
MELMRDPISIPFRLGMAYPLRGQLFGEGVGATRLGEFSTGTAVERVTEWVSVRKLAFVTLTDVPAMRELNPYTDVHAPHVIGYFRTINASFELLPDATGSTQVLERTAHELRLEPVLCWLLLARWAAAEQCARAAPSQAPGRAGGFRALGRGRTRCRGQCCGQPRRCRQPSRRPTSRRWAIPSVWLLSAG